MAYAEDSNYKPKPKKTPLVGKTTKKQADFYHKQRLSAEAGEKKGKLKDTLTARTIHEKGFGKTTNTERDFDKPGASEDTQRAATFGALGGAGDLAGVIGAMGRRGGEMLSESIGRSLAQVGAGKSAGRAMGRTALPRGEAIGPRVVGKATVERPALPKAAAARKAPSAAAKREVNARTSGPATGKVPRRRALGKGPEAPKGQGKFAGKYTPRQKGTNPRAKKEGGKEGVRAGTHPRAKGTNPRALRKASE